MLRRTVSVCMAVLALGPAMSAWAGAESPFDRLVVFGDSLSDGGNAGRYSNGPVWVEQLAVRLGLELRPSRERGFNFAVGGAHLDPGSGPDSLRAQADAFLALPKPQGRTLHIVYGGGNDLLAAIGHPRAPMLADAAATSLRSILADLVAHGATDVLVPNLPDVGMTPAVRARGDRAVAEAAVLTDRFNAALERVLTAFAAEPRLRLYRLDVRSMAERVRQDPGASGFVDIASPCSRLRRCDGYLFWDDVHPTAEAHARLAEAAFAALSPMGR